MGLRGTKAQDCGPQLTPVRLPGFCSWAGLGREALTRRMRDRKFSSRAPFDSSHCAGKGGGEEGEGGGGGEGERNPVFKMIFEYIKLNKCAS